MQLNVAKCLDVHPDTDLVLALSCRVAQVGFEFGPKVHQLSDLRVIISYCEATKTVS